MENKATLEYTGLKCDNCDYKDENIDRSEFENYINRPCPECGENLLTFNDYLNVLILENAVYDVNELNFGKKVKKEDIKTVNINTHGTITFEE